MKKTLTDLHIAIVDGVIVLTGTDGDGNKITLTGAALINRPEGAIAVDADHTVYELS